MMYIEIQLKLNHPDPVRFRKYHIIGHARSVYQSIIC